MAKALAAIVVVIALIGGGVLLFGGSNDGEMATEPAANTSETTVFAPSQDESLVQESIAGGGELIDYTSSALGESDADTNILFFHASWCTVCNSVERNLKAGNIPEGVSILKIDYDSSEGRDLADKYNIPIQYSMVQVDKSGNEITQWVNQSFFTIEDILEKIQTT